MAIINNRKKIASEVPSQKYKDNWDAIFGNKKKKGLVGDYQEQVVLSQEQEVQDTGISLESTEAEYMSDEDIVNLNNQIVRGKAN